MNKGWKGVWNAINVEERLLCAFNTGNGTLAYRWQWCLHRGNGMALAGMPKAFSAHLGTIYVFSISLAKMLFSRSTGM
jgi:hypothetical protein